MSLMITYVHNHECKLSGQKYVYYPTSKMGLSFIVPPVCEEANVQLEEVEREKIGR